MSDNNQAKLVAYLLLRKNQEVFLVKYKDSPNPKRSGWWIPAPELAYGEHPEDCAMRIMKSLGVDNVQPTFAGIDSFITKDWHMLFYYTADVNVAPILGSQYETGSWFKLEDLPDTREFAHGGWERDLVLRLARSEL